MITARTLSILGDRLRRRLAGLTVAVLAGSVGATACGDDALVPAVDCGDSAGFIFVELLPAPSGTFADYQIDVGDSIQVSASLRRIDAAEPAFNVQLGWYCVTTASSPVSGSVALSTNDTLLVRLGPDGWIRGLSPGLAAVTASSRSPVANATIAVLVYSS